MGKLGNFASAVLGGLVVLVGQQAITKLNNKAPTLNSMCGTERIEVIFNDDFAPGMKAFIQNGLRNEKLENLDYYRDSAAFLLPEDVRTYDDFTLYAIDINGKKYEQNFCVHNNSIINKNLCLENIP